MPPVLTVALYHHIADEPGPSIDRLAVTTSPRRFEQQLDWLERRYDVVDLDTVLAGGPLPRRPLLLTFDDGYRSVLDVAAATLRRRGLPSVFFVSAAFLGDTLPLDNVLCGLTHTHDPAELGEAIGPGPPCATLRDLIARVALQPYERRRILPAEIRERFGVADGDGTGVLLEPEELAGLAGLGMAVGNHSRSHIHCRALLESDHLERELVSYRPELERLTGAPVRAFAYPYGQAPDTTPVVEAALAGSGHEATFQVGARSNRWRRGGPWSRVSFQDQAPAEMLRHLRLEPLARSVRDRLLR
ncbi:MAG: polysaccharide deacetylase family protein [Solirubrobacteraceae bacterium]